MTAQTASQGIFATVLFAALVGFLSCAALDLNAKQVRQGQTSLMRAALAGWCSLYSWGMIFFAGVGMMTVCWAMGDRSPLPLTAPIDGEKITFPTLLSVWLLLCSAGLAAQRAIRVLRRPKDAVPMLRLMSAVLVASLSLLAMGCGAGAPSGSYLDAHERLYKSKVPFLNAYAAEHPTDAPAIRDNVAAEGLLIQNAKAGVLPSAR